MERGGCARDAVAVTIKDGNKGGQNAKNCNGRVQLLNPRCETARTAGRQRRGFSLNELNDCVPAPRSTHQSREQSNSKEYVHFTRNATERG